MNPSIFDRRVVLLIAVLCVCCGCTPVSTVKETKGWPSRFDPRPSDTSVIGATTIRCCDVPCRLLGIKEPDDPAARKKAEEFTRAWFKHHVDGIVRRHPDLDIPSIGIQIRNYWNPLVDKDGVAVVWIGMAAAGHPCLNEDLVRVGLVEIEIEKWKDYTYQESSKEGHYDYNWLGRLQEAKDEYASGKRPELDFEWPPK